MKKDFNFSRPSGSWKNEPKVLSEVLNEYLRSDEPLATALRRWKARSEAVKQAEEQDVDDRLFTDIYPDTHLGVDLKMLNCQPGRMKVGDFLSGVITRDGLFHFSFVQNAIKKKVVRPRNPHFYVGKCINVTCTDEGTLYPTFNRPRYTKSFTFRDFCREAAEELILVSGLVGEE